MDPFFMVFAARQPEIDKTSDSTKNACCLKHVFPRSWFFPKKNAHCENTVFFQSGLSSFLHCVFHHLGDAQKKKSTGPIVGKLKRAPVLVVKMLTNTWDLSQNWLCVDCCHESVLCVRCEMCQKPSVSSHILWREAFFIRMGPKQTGNDSILGSSSPYYDSSQRATLSTHKQNTTHAHTTNADTNTHTHTHTLDDEFCVSYAIHMFENLLFQKVSLPPHLAPFTVFEKYGLERHKSLIQKQS